MTDACIVARGVDTLVMNVWYSDEGGSPLKRDLPDTLRLQADEWKRAAQEFHMEYPTSWIFNGATLLMCPNGAGQGQFPWMLKTHDLTFYLSTGRWNGVASVRCSALYLWSCQGVGDAVQRVRDWLSVLFGETMYLQCSSIDLCADVAGWQDIEQLDRHTHFVTRARKRGRFTQTDEEPDLRTGEFSLGLHQTGLEFGSSKGKSGSLSCTIYNKTREIERSGKQWFADLWDYWGWQHQTHGPIWRVELKYRREALHELLHAQDDEILLHGLEEVGQVLDALALLWAYGVGQVDGGVDGLPDGWLRCVVPGSDKNRSRWPTHPVWKVVQGAFSEDRDTPDQFGTLVRKRHEEHQIEKAVEAMMGYATSVCAWVGGELACPENDLTIFLQWFAQEGQAYLSRKRLDFGTEVQHKRVKFGRVPAPAVAAASASTRR